MDSAGNAVAGAAGFGYLCQSTREADTRLMAAAPDLLAALRALVGELIATWGGHSTALKSRIEIAHAAICKATGEADVPHDYGPGVCRRCGDVHQVADR